MHTDGNRTDHLWHPFTQMQRWAQEEQLEIVEASGTTLVDSNGRHYIDGVSSLWCNVHGHRHPYIDEAVRRQLDRAAHTTLLGLSHPAATELASRLVEITPAGLGRVFFSDSGSEATEIALKMAFQYWQKQGGEAAKRTRFINLEQAYHGDTIGAVSVGGIDLFHRIYKPLLFNSLKAPAGDIEAMEGLLREHEGQVAAVIVEPLIQGAAGMMLQPPGYLAHVRKLCDRFGTLLICDEVATGFGRTGTMFACEQEGVSPDFLCLAKGITGGYLPLAATVTTERVYQGFLGSHDEARTFFHGHTYTGNPLACAAALASLDLFEREDTLERLKPKIELFARLVGELEDAPQVLEVRQLGFMAGIELARDPDSGTPFPAGDRIGHQVTLEARTRGAIIRPLGDVIVLMPPLSIEEKELKKLVSIVHQSIEAATAKYVEKERAAAT